MPQKPSGNNAKPGYSPMEYSPDEAPNLIPEPLDYQRQELMSLIEEIVDCCHHRVDHISQMVGLAPAEVKAIMCFAGQRYTTAGVLAEKLGVVKSRVAKLLADLGNKGLVERISDPNDGRVKLLWLTPSGRAKLAEVEGINQQVHQRLLAELAPRDRNLVLSALATLRAGMEVIKREMGIDLG